MCGICGVVSAGARSDLGDLARRMSGAMVHRGPDAAGHLDEPGIAMSMRRLSIIDRATGQQPMLNEDGDIAVILNGEIYNFQDLRTELEKKGHRFRTLSDTEAIVHAYEEWGEGCLNRLRGMFALAIYDRRRADVREGGCGQLLLARDRLGIKPLYYVRRPGMLLFASEVRALLASRAFTPELSLAGLESYLLFGSVSEPATLIEGVRSLPPGHSVRLPVGTSILESVPQPYWSLAKKKDPDETPRPDGSPARTLRALLEDSVRVHLISDEPLGIFLSGGVDSTAVAALASRAQSGVRCYTVRFREREFDESEVARRTAKRLGVDHCELLIDAGEMLSGMDDAIAALDQPSTDGINTYCVSALVRRAGGKVALSGLGGDELFGGYRTFRWMPRLTQLSAVAKRTPGALRRAGASALVTAGDLFGQPEHTDRLASIWRDPEALPHPFFFARTIFGPAEVNRLVKSAAPGRRSEPWRQWNDETIAGAKSLDSFTAVSHLELRSYMLNTLLRDADAMSMAHSLELRVPLLDHPIVEFVASQPGRIKQRGHVYKPMLVEALSDLLPPEVTNRPKQGFTFPWAQWTRAQLAPRIESRLRNLTPALAACLDSTAVAGTWERFQAGRSGWLRPWSVYVLDQWVRHHL
jgi:asparagine synthase (glutamine-hydrolysing)